MSEVSDLARMQNVTTPERPGLALMLMPGLALMLMLTPGRPRDQEDDGLNDTQRRVRRRVWTWLVVICPEKTFSPGMMLGMPERILLSLQTEFVGTDAALVARCGLDEGGVFAGGARFVGSRSEHKIYLGPRGDNRAIVFSVVWI